MYQMKEQDKTAEKQLNEVEISNLHKQNSGNFVALLDRTVSLMRGTDAPSCYLC